MGIAAYNRGTAVHRRNIDSKMPVQESFDSLNALPRGNTKLFRETVVRLLPSGRTWCLMNKPEEGFASRGYEYKSLRALFADWSAYVIGCGRDAHSFFYRVCSV